LRKQLRSAAYQDVPEAVPILIVIVDQKCHVGDGLDILQTFEPFAWNALGFQVDGRVETVAVKSKTDWYDVRSILGIQRRQSRNSGFF
jgi:hypothetical protein